LIEKGIDVNQTENDGNNALLWASREGHYKIVVYLLEKGININEKEETL
jgi:ankyrin repeat protein